MNTTTPVTELVTDFSEPDATARPWSEAAHVLERSEMYWISTTRRDGRPHVTPLVAVWLDEALHFCTGPEEQKAKNLESDARCVLTTGTNDFGSGLDVVVEGTAVRVTDDQQLGRLASMWKSKYDWPFEVVDGGFRDPGLAGHLAYVFAVRPAKVLAFAKGSPFSQTRYRFQ